MPVRVKKARQEYKVRFQVMWMRLRVKKTRQTKEYLKDGKSDVSALRR
jgi:hypothetical protein